MQIREALYNHLIQHLPLPALVTLGSTNTEWHQLLSAVPVSELAPSAQHSLLPQGMTSELPWMRILQQQAELMALLRGHLPGGIHEHKIHDQMPEGHEPGDTIYSISWSHTIYLEQDAVWLQILQRPLHGMGISSGPPYHQGYPAYGPCTVTVCKQQPSSAMRHAHTRPPNQPQPTEQGDFEFMVQHRHAAHFSQVISTSTHLVMYPNPHGRFQALAVEDKATIMLVDKRTGDKSSFPLGASNSIERLPKWLACGPVSPTGHAIAWPRIDLVAGSFAQPAAKQEVVIVSLPELLVQARLQGPDSLVTTQRAQGTRTFAIKQIEWSPDASKVFVVWGQDVELHARRLLVFLGFAQAPVGTLPDAYSRALCLKVYAADTGISLCEPSQLCNECLAQWSTSDSILLLSYNTTYILKVAQSGPDTSYRRTIFTQDLEHPMRILRQTAKAFVAPSKTMVLIVNVTEPYDAGMPHHCAFTLMHLDSGTKIHRHSSQRQKHRPASVFPAVATWSSNSRSCLLREERQVLVIQQGNGASHPLTCCLQTLQNQRCRPDMHQLENGALSLSPCGTVVAGCESSHGCESPIRPALHWHLASDSKMKLEGEIWSADQSGQVIDVFPEHCHGLQGRLNHGQLAWHPLTAAAVYAIADENDRVFLVNSKANCVVLSSSLRTAEPFSLPQLPWGDSSFKKANGMRTHAPVAFSWSPNGHQLAVVSGDKKAVLSFDSSS